MASVKAEKPVGSKSAGPAKKESVKAPVSIPVSSPAPRAPVFTPVPGPAPTAPVSTPAPSSAPKLPVSTPFPGTAPKASVSTRTTPVSRLAPKKVEQKPQEPKKKVTGSKPSPAKKI